MKAANMAGMKSVNDACASQFSDYKASSRANSFFLTSTFPHWTALISAIFLNLYT